MCMCEREKRKERGRDREGWEEGRMKEGREGERNRDRFWWKVASHFHTMGYFLLFIFYSALFFLLNTS